MRDDLERDELIFKLKAALEFYANFHSWEGNVIQGDLGLFQGQFNDHYIGGNLARQVITHLFGEDSDLLEEEISEDETLDAFLKRMKLEE